MKAQDAFKGTWGLTTMMQQHTARSISGSRPQEQQQLLKRPQPAALPRRSKRLKGNRSIKSSSGSGSSGSEGSHSADGNLHDGAPAQTPSSSRTMRRRPQTTQQPIGAAVPGAACLSSAALKLPQRVAVNRRRRPSATATSRQQQQPYSPRKYLLEQMRKCQERQERLLSVTHRHFNGLTSSSLARQLARQQELAQRPTEVAADAVSRLWSARDDAMQTIKSKSKTHQWHWSDPDGIQEQRLLSDDRLEVCFHPECAESTVAIKGSQPFRRNGNYYYWEVTIYDKIFGTSMMLGLCTEDQALHKSDYCNLVGLDQHGWSLSHKGLIWHNGKYSKYTNDFTTNQSLTVGLLYDTMRGELSYLINGVNLGVAFTGLNKCNKDLYPVVGSTAKRTRMRLTGSYCGYVSLLERTCYTILKSIKNEADLVQTLQDNRIPQTLISQMAQLAEVCRNQTQNKIATSAQSG